jgi:hypothetical protein
LNGAWCGVEASPLAHADRCATPQPSPQFRLRLPPERMGMTRPVPHCRASSPAVLGPVAAVGASAMAAPPEARLYACPAEPGLSLIDVLSTGGVTFLSG